jgi:PadR family transcriptional regulator, regulatory protein AphA
MGLGPRSRPLSHGTIRMVMARATSSSVVPISLGPTSYLVLGMLTSFGPSTPYELKRYVADSVGHFWSFPHAQLYSEPVRLAGAGLVAEKREPAGRRRRVFRVTPAGRRALRDWLAEASAEPTEIRDLGLLKLFFADQAGPDDVRRLAEAQLAGHGDKLVVYKALDTRYAGVSTRYPAYTLQLGLAFERMAVGFWRRVLDEL